MCRLILSTISNNISLPDIFLDRSAAAVTHRVCPMNGRGHGPGGYRCLSHTGQLYNIHNTAAMVINTGNTLTLSARGSSLQMLSKNER